MKKIKFNINDILLFISICLIQFAVYTKNVVTVTKNSQNLMNIALGILFVNALIQIVKMKATIKQWILCFLIVSISIFSFIKTNDSLLLQLSLILIGSLNVNLDKLILKNLIFKLALFIYIYHAQMTGNVDIQYFYRDGIIRNALGFNQPNALGFFLLSFFIEFVYLKRKNLKIINILVLFFPIIYFMINAGCRGAIISLFIFVLFILIMLLKNRIVKDKESKEKRRMFNWLIPIFSILTLVSFYITYEYMSGSNLAIILDDFFSERFYLQSLFLKLYKISIFGTEIFYFDTLDNVYIRVLLNFGIIVWILYMFIYYIIVKCALEKKDIVMLIIVFVFMIYGLMEWYIVRPGLNIFLIYFSSSLINMKNKKEINNE